MTERGRGALRRSARRLEIGPSALDWDGEALTVTIDERSVPGMRPIRGTVRVVPEALSSTELALDPAGRHLWRPFAPRSRIEVALDSPAVSWTGHGYLDGNFGERPLEADFVRWDWCRAPLREGAAILYEATTRDGGTRARALRFDRDGAAREFEPPARAELGPGLWRVARPTRSEGRARLVTKLVDAPFYTREVIESRLCGEDVTAVHESLDLDRFANPLVRLMLPFRIPRRRR